MAQGRWIAAQGSRSDGFEASMALREPTVTEELIVSEKLIDALDQFMLLLHWSDA
ncbi:hypothetical protein [Kushneria marisflavi]|uniref:hypothetical protein n=1 Tax=Kushneria marisflavi TaxID=157779 RepID=UPI000FF383F0|nr:hypothetical protein [Kushneria marisflavi]RKD84036.1 hypothetical protein C8D96_2890 [Kushneria marisflavi]